MKKIFFIITILIFTSYLLAHPHIYTIVNAEYVFDEIGLKGIQFEWNLDDMTSSIVMRDYDTDYDGTLSKPEYMKLLDENTTLKENNYFFDIKLNNKTILVKELENFMAEYVDIYLIYSFFLPIRMDVNEGESVLEIEIYDRTYYSAFFLNQEEGVTFSNAENFNYSVEFYQNKNKAYYQGRVIPDGTKFILEGKK